MASSAVNITPEMGAGNYASSVFWQSALDGNFRFSRTLANYYLTGLAEILPAFQKVTTVGMDVKTDYRRSIILHHSDEALLLLSEDSDGYFSAQVAAQSVELAQKWIDALSDLLVPVPPRPEVPYEVPLTYWLNTSLGPRSFRRWVDSKPWAEIAENYPAATRHAMNQIANLNGFDEGGKLVLVHGEPGTGKTRAILGLVETWRQWANVNIVTDPDQFFGDASYMLEVVMGADPETWNIIVIEDGDEFMDAADSGRKSQSVGRLLNLNDGFIGQGMKVATLISTNVDMASFNSAVTRPGRCLANIEFPRFDVEGANQWLSAHDLQTDKEMTLAEMYDLVRRTNAVRSLMARFDKS